MQQTIRSLPLDPKPSLSILDTMLLIRRFEEQVIRLAAAGHRMGTIHVYIGQEGTGAAVLHATHEQDLIFTNHRNHGHVIGRGADPGRAFAEMLGRGTGLLGGRGGGQHLADASRGILHTSAIVGGAISLAVGAAYAIKQKGDDKVAVAFFGDSVLEEGVAFEALNLASMWKLPIIFVCENNSLKAQGVANKGYPTLIHAAQNLSRIPESLGISCCRLTDGADIASVYAATAAARVACRSGAGPFFIEALTVRWPGSQTVIPTLTSSTNLNAALEGPKVQDSADDWSADHDPLLRWIAELVSKNISTRDDVLARDAAVESQISAALQFALDSPLPDVHSAAKGVFA